MKKCCKKWKHHIGWIEREQGDLWTEDMEGSLIFVDLRMFAEFCPECGSSLKEVIQPEAEYQYPKWCEECALQGTDNCKDCCDIYHSPPSQFLYKEPSAIKPPPKLPEKLSYFALDDGSNECKLVNAYNRLIDYLRTEEKRKEKIFEELEEEIKNLERQEP